MFRNYLSTIGPVDLLTHTIQLRTGGTAETSITHDRSGAGLWTLAQVHAADSNDLHADVWERHPAGNEVLVVTAGVVHLHLRDRGDRGPAATLRPGEAVVVPIGAWHRLEVAEPADLLAITPRSGTRHERVASELHGDTP